MDKNFLDIVFPENITYGSYGGPEYKTEIVELRSGHEDRRAVFENGRCRYNISHNIVSGDGSLRLIEFFRIVRGRLIGFCFKDWSDFTVENQLLDNIIENDGIYCAKLIKRYNFNDFFYPRWIKRPILRTIKLFSENRSRQINKDEYFFDGQINMIVFKNKNLGNIYADFEFHVPVRFDIDYLPIIIHDNGHFLAEDIPLVEIEL